MVDEPAIVMFMDRNTALKWTREKDEYDGRIEYVAEGASGYRYCIWKDPYVAGCYYPWITSYKCSGYETLRDAKAGCEAREAKRQAAA